MAGGDDQGAGIGQLHRGEKIVGDAGREFGEDVGGRRGDEKQIGLLRNRDMFDGVLKIGFLAGLGE